MYDTSMYDTSIHTSSYIYTCTCHACTHVFIYVYTHVYTCIYAFTDIFLCTHVVLIYRYTWSVAAGIAGTCGQKEFGADGVEPGEQ